MFPWRDVESSRLLVMDGYAIDSDVYPIGIQIFLDDEAARADVTVSIIFVPLGSGKHGQIHVVPFSDVFIHRAVRYPAWGNFRILFRVLPPGLNQFHLAGFGRQPQS